jgi:ABC-type nitrate/sulfonate/bicarbonate transport system permease component
VTGGFNLLLGEWLRAAFFLGVGFVFLKGREIDRWPKAARYLIIVVVVALSVAMFVRLIFDAKALK